MKLKNFIKMCGNNIQEYSIGYGKYQMDIKNNAMDIAPQLMNAKVKYYEFIKNKGRETMFISVELREG